MTTEILLALIGIDTVLLMIAATLIVKSPSAQNRRLIQILFAAIVPIVGPAITIAIHWTDLMPRPKPSDRMIGQSIDESEAASKIVPD